MAITFNNVTYTNPNINTGFWCNAFRSGNSVMLNSSFGPGSITLNGTVNAVGDTVAWAADFGGSGAFEVTDLDDNGTIVFKESGVASYYVFSNTALSPSQIINFTETVLGDYQVACFVAGTRILTRYGEVPVETLSVGDEVVALARGGLARVAWIGEQQVDCRAPPHGAQLRPIRVLAGAFAPGVPYADLLLSPDHAVHLDGALIPIRYLDNGTTIRREALDEVTYFHVELDRHDLLLAEGLATESYLDTGNREDFLGLARDPAHAAADERAARGVWAEQACRPLHVGGPVVLAARTRLAARASAMELSPSDDGDLRLRVDGVDHLPVRDGGRFVFTLPMAAAGARLVSDSFVPAVTFPDNIDRRCLGVPVAAVAVDGQALPLDDVRLLRRGWHKAEPGLRWTDGAADLPIFTRLEVTLAQVARHPGLAAVA